LERLLPEYEHWCAELAASEGADALGNAGPHHRLRNSSAGIGPPKMRLAALSQSTSPGTRMASGAPGAVGRPVKRPLDRLIVRPVSAVSCRSALVRNGR
jgi:hypothetical protein